MSEQNQSPQRTYEALCSHCGGACRTSNGKEVYPHLPRLADKVIYVCDGCDARVGAHEATGQPLGTAANAELRQLRITVHNLLDREWKAAPKGALRRRLRSEAYQGLSQALGLPEADTHVGMFDAERCRRAIAHLKAAGAHASA